MALLVQEVAPPGHDADFIARGLNREHLISTYFHQGYTAVHICLILALRHRIFLSIRHLRRLLRSMGLRWNHRRTAPVHETMLPSETSYMGAVDYLDTALCGID